MFKIAEEYDIMILYKQESEKHKMKVLLGEATSFNVSHDIVDCPSGVEIDLSDLEIVMNKNHGVLETSIFSKIRVKIDAGSIEFEANETTEDLVLGALFDQYAIYIKDMKVSRAEIDEASLERTIEMLEETCLLLTFILDN